jgi:hypothetical protein
LATEFTQYITFTGSPNPAVFTLDPEGAEANITSVFDQIDLSFPQVNLYVSSPPFNATCSVLAALGNINFINFTVINISSGTVYSSLFTSSSPSGTSLVIQLNSTGGYRGVCEYEWVSNATGTTLVYRNSNSFTIWITADALTGAWSAISVDQSAGILIAMFFVIAIAGGISLLSPTFGLFVGVLLMLIFAWVGFVPWLMAALAILAAVSIVFLKGGF